MQSVIIDLSLKDKNAWLDLLIKLQKKASSMTGIPEKSTKAA